MSEADMSASKHALILLASGLSQRLGHPKQLLNKNGNSLISHMIRLALATKPQVIIVVIPKGNPKIAQTLDDWIDKEPKIQTAINSSPENGMGQSLYLGIDALTYFSTSNDSSDHSIERILIMGVDQVLLNESHLCHLLAGNSTVVASGYESWQLLNEHILEKDKPEKALEKRSIKNIIGLPLVIDYSLLKQWQSALSGDKGLRYLVRALPPHQIETVINQHLSYDIDTPEQLSYAKQQGWLDD